MSNSYLLLYYAQESGLLTQRVRGLLRARALSQPASGWLDYDFQCIFPLLGRERLPDYLEALLATSLTASYYYARYVLRGPFPMGEPTIALDSYYSHFYASIVLQGRFPQGEASIVKNPALARDYWKNFCKSDYPSYKEWKRVVKRAGDTC